MIETVLFVGGSIDGKRINITEGVRYFDIPRLEKGGFGRERYQRETLTNGKEDFSVFSTESSDNLIPLLIEGYRKRGKL